MSPSEQPPATPEIDWKDLGNDLGAAATNALRGVLEGAEEDLQAFAAELVVSIGVATAAGDEEHLERLKNQAGVLAESHRVAVSTVGWSFVVDVAGALVQAAQIGISKGLGGLA